MLGNLLNMLELFRLNQFLAFNHDGTARCFEIVIFYFKCSSTLDEYGNFLNAFGSSRPVPKLAKAKPNTTHHIQFAKQWLVLVPHLQIATSITVPLPPHEKTPAPAQGVVL